MELSELREVLVKLIDLIDKGEKVLPNLPTESCMNCEYGKKNTCKYHKTVEDPIRYNCILYRKYED